MCDHERQRGALSWGANGQLEAWLVCDECQRKIRYMPAQTREANACFTGCFHVKPAPANASPLAA